MNPKIISFLVNESNFLDLRVDRWLVDQDLNFSRNVIADLFFKKKILVNSQIVKPSYKIKINDHIQIEIPEKISSNIIPLEQPLKILYQDNDLAVVNKPAGLVVHPAAGHAQDTLVNLLVFHIKDLSMKNENRPGIVHRIDKETSGLLVVAKNDLAHEKIALQFKNKTSHRIYFAILEGNLIKKTGIIKSYLQRSSVDRKKYSSVKINNKIVTDPHSNVLNAKWAVTEFECLAHSNNKSLVRLKLQTGRTHQIRVHMSELGFPLVGDITYGFSKKKYSEMKLTRFFLHAAELGFLHPSSEEYMQWSIDWPEEDKKQIKAWGFDV